MPFPDFEVRDATLALYSTHQPRSTRGEFIIVLYILAFQKRKRKEITHDD